jgi:DNA polymerase elongation subunit (family B)
VNVDTDSFSCCKPDQSSWTKEEVAKFLNYINSKFPELIKFDDDGLYDKVLVLKSKNYVLLTGSKRKIKGSALKDQKKAPALLKFIEQIIDILLNNGTQEDVNNLYKSYIKKANNITDITEWCKKVTITDKILKCKGHAEMSPEKKKELGIRANESKIYDALHGKHVQEGDKIYLYFKSNRDYGLLETWDGDYSKEDLMKNIHSCVNTFKNLLDMDGFVKYHLKGNKKLLEELLSEM